MNNTKRYLKAGFFGFIYAMASLTPAWADDIEVYFNNSSAPQSKPNVLIVFDTSGSFKSKIPITDSKGNIIHQGDTLDANGDLVTASGSSTVLEHTKAQAAAAAVKDFITNGTGKNYNVGLMRFNDWGAAVRFPVSDVNATVKSLYPAEPDNTITVRQKLIDTINNDNGSGLSNIRAAYYEAARYMRGDDVDFGISRGGERGITIPYSGQFTNEEKDRLSHLYSLESGTYIHSIPSGCTNPDNSSDSVCKDEKLLPNGTTKPKYKSPISADSCGGNHIIMVSDSASVDYAELWDVKNLMNQPALKCSGESGTPNFILKDGTSISPDSDFRCVTEMANWLNTTDQSSASGKQTIKTHYIYYEDGGTTYARQKGKLYAEPGGGIYVEAASRFALSNALADIGKTVIDTTATFVAPAASVNAFNRLYNRDDLYFSIFKPSLNDRWDGNLKKYKFKTTNTPAATVTDPEFLDITDATNKKAILNGGFNPTAQSFWSTAIDGVDITKGGAASKINNFATRNVYTFTGSYSGATPSQELLTHSDNNFSTSNTTKLTAAMIGATNDTQRTNLIDWARGKHLTVNTPPDKITSTILTNALNANNSAITATRHVIADPLHSHPATINYGGTATNPDTTIFLSTNAGFLHAINAETGAEQFSFIPKELLSKIRTQYDNDNSGNHIYGLDSSINSWTYDADKDGVIESTDGDHVYLFFGMRRGGNNYYAMDVTNRSQPKLKWVIRGGAGGTAGFTNMGQSWAEPLRTKIKISVAGVSTTKNVLILTGGYDTSHDTKTTRADDTFGAALYIVDAQTGALIWSGSKNADTTTPTINKQFTNMKYSITAAPAAIDINRDGFVDQLYVGDLGGQVWRFDISNDQTASNLVSGGVIADLGVGSNNNPTTSGNTVADNRRFYHSPEVALSRNSNGQLALSILIGSGYREHPLTTTTNDRFYAIKQTNVYTKTTSYGTPLKESNLYDATTDNIGALTTTAQQTALTTLEAQSGWLLRLTNNGEKVMSAPLAREGAVYFSSYEPTANGNSCQAVFGTNRFYGLNINTAAGVGGWANVAGGARSTIQEGVNFIDRPTTIVSPSGDIIGIGSPTKLEDTNDGIDNGLSKTYWQ